MSNGLQTFNTAYPFNIAFENEYQGEQLPVLYIVDDGNVDPKIIDINFRITPTDSAQYSLRGFGEQAGSSASSSNQSGAAGFSMLYPTDAQFIPNQGGYNLGIAFRPGVLKESIITKFSALFQQGLSAAFPNNTVVVNGPRIRAIDGAYIWYAGFKDDEIIPPTGISFEIAGLSASSAAGSRSSQVEVMLSDLFLSENIQPLSFRRSIHIDIINHQGHKSAPLYFGMLGANHLVKIQ
jgi:hypothetical protein